MDAQPDSALLGPVYERKDDIRHRLRVTLRETTSKQKCRLLYGLVGLPVKGFHCRTRDELQRLDVFLRTHFPVDMALGRPIAYVSMEAKLQELDGGLSTDDAPPYPRPDASMNRPRCDSVTTSSLSMTTVSSEEMESSLRSGTHSPALSECESAGTMTTTRNGPLNPLKRASLGGIQVHTTGDGNAEPQQQQRTSGKKQCVNPGSSCSPQLNTHLPHFPFQSHVTLPLAVPVPMPVPIPSNVTTAAAAAMLHPGFLAFQQHQQRKLQATALLFKRIAAQQQFAAMFQQQQQQMYNVPIPDFKLSKSSATPPSSEQQDNQTNTTPPADAPPCVKRREMVSEPRQDDPSIHAAALGLLDMATPNTVTAVSFSV